MLLDISCRDRCCCLLIAEEKKKASSRSCESSHAPAGGSQHSGCSYYCVPRPSNWLGYERASTPALLIPVSVENILWILANRYKLKTRESTNSQMIKQGVNEMPQEGPSFILEAGEGVSFSHSSPLWCNASLIVKGKRGWTSSIDGCSVCTDISHTLGNHTHALGFIMMRNYMIWFNHLEKH